MQDGGYGVCGICRPEANEDVCGTETYAVCTYSESITINGISYPVSVYSDEENDE